MLRSEARQALGLPPTFERADLDAAYRRLAGRTHPDAGGSSDEFVAVTEAYRLLVRRPPTPSTVVAADDRPRLVRLLRQWQRRHNRSRRLG